MSTGPLIPFSHHLSSPASQISSAFHSLFEFSPRDTNFLSDAVQTSAASLDPSRVSPINKDQSALLHPPFSAQKTTDNLSEEEQLNQDFDLWEKSYQELCIRIQAKQHANFFQTVKQIDRFRDAAQEFLYNISHITLIKQAGDHLGSAASILKGFKPLGASFLSFSDWYSYENSKKELEKLYQKYNRLKLNKDLDKKINRYFSELNQKQLESQQNTFSHLFKAFSYEVFPRFATNFTPFKDWATREVRKSVKLATEIGDFVSEFSKASQIDQARADWISDLDSPILLKKPNLAENAQNQPEQDNLEIEGKDQQHYQQMLAKQEQLKVKLNQFFDSLSDCQSLENVESYLAKYSIEIQLPEKMEQWKELLEKDRFRKFLSSRYQAFVNQKLMIRSEDIISYLEREKEIFQDNIDKAHLKLAPLFAELNTLAFEDILKRLKEKHLSLNFEGAPKNKDEWIAQFNAGDLQTPLCKQWVEYQQTVDRLSQQGTRNSLQMKIQVERKLLVYHWIEKATKIGLLMLQIAFFLPLLKVWYPALYPLRYFFTELPIPGINLLTNFYTQELTVDTIAMAGINHVVKSQFNPHAYSLKSYKIQIELRWAKIKAQLYYFFNYVQQFQLWVRIEIVKKLRFDPQLSAELTSRKRNVITQLEQYMQENKNCQDKFIKDLNQLNLQDADYIILNNRLLKDKNGQAYSPVQTLADALTDLDVDCLSKSSVEFYEKNLGVFLLTDEKPVIKKKMLNCFLQGDFKFFENFGNRQNTFIQG